MDCIFCKITNKEIPADIVFENEDLMVFKDANPSAPIHYLIVPKEHIQSIAHLEDNHKEVLSKLIYIAKQEAKKINLKGYKLIFNVGKEGGQIIDHLHLHLLGGWNNNKEKTEQENVHMKV
jgi:histidine triad (HIT) family protein